MENFVKELERQAKQELREEKAKVAKSVIKERIKEIEKTEKLLTTLKSRYTEILSKSIDEIVDGVENDNIRF